MSKEEKYYCARCNSDLTKKMFNCYASEIDRKLICLECFKKEQPKYLADKVADLEAKLAEKEELIENYKMGYTGKVWKQQNNEIYILKAIVKDQDKEIAKLKQQLADKEKEIEKLNNQILITQLQQTSKEQILNIIGSSAYQYNPMHEKISFAVEQLEKVKELIDLEYGHINIIDTIDNQIKQLKEGK